MNWTPLSGARVHRAGREWGLCIEFAQSGLGNSGRAQRWRTLVLVPARSRRAYRLIGYWASCDALVEGGRAGEVRLPIVEPTQFGADSMHIVWHRCDAQRCVREPDSRNVEGSPVSEDGSLVIH